MSRKKNRKRNREELENLMNSQNYSEDEGVNDVKTISFQNGDVSLMLEGQSNYYSYGKTDDYDEDLIGSDYFWHQVKILHQKKFDVKAKVLPEIYKIVGDELFAPIAYRTSREFDYFFVCRQGAALKKLFDNDLRVVIDDGRHVDLVVKMCVSKFVNGMLTLPNKLSKIISSSVDVQGSHPTLLNLSHIAGHQQLTDVKFTMSNQGCFAMIVNSLCEAPHMLQNVNALSLANNEIACLKPLTRLVGFDTLHILDLKYNNLTSFDTFVHLKHLRLKEIIVIGNPITEVPMFKEKIKAILPSLEKVDSTNVVKTSLAVDNRSEPIQRFNTNSTAIVRPADVNDYFKKTFAKHDSDLWNKVIVKHKGKVKKSNILIHINRQLFKRLLFVPCYYESGEKFDTFYLHDNFDALNALVQKNLVMTIPTIKTEIKFELQLKCADWIDGHINWRNKINYALKKRFKGSRLDLDDLAGDSDLNDNLIVTMSSIATLCHVLKAALEMNRKVGTMTLKENKITTVEGFHVLKEFKCLGTLDLRDNYIESFEIFPVLPSVTKVFVDGNPFCVSSNYYNAPWRYIEEMMRIFPNLQEIDDRCIDKNFIPIVPLQNFLVSPSSYNLTETFIRRFFEVYDSHSRRKSLVKFYGENSIFSVSSNLSPTQMPTNAFEANSRNLLHNINVNQGSSRVFIGGETIVDFFEKLPASLHDFPTLCIDVPIMNEQYVLININGFFKDQNGGDSLNDDEVYFKFTRTFLLERLMNRVPGTLKNTHRFIIKNDLLQVREVGPDESVKAFKKNVVSEAEVQRICWKMMPQKSQAKEANVLLLREFTKLRTKYCNRLLQDANWDIKVALQHFVSLIDRNFFSEDDFHF